MKKWVVFLAIIIVISIISYSYIYQNHRDIETEQAEFSVASTEIINEFSSNPVNAEKKYLNKTIETFGEVTEKSKNTTTLDNIVFCQFSNPIEETIKKNTQIRIKGRFIGYDDLLEQIKLDQCIVIH